MSISESELPHLNFNDTKPQSYFDRIPLGTEDYSIDELDEALRGFIAPLLECLFPDEEMRVHGDFVSVGVDGLFVLVRGFCSGDFFPADFGYIGSPVDLIGVATGQDREASVECASSGFLEQTAA